MEPYVETPSRQNEIIRNKVRSNGVHCDSPFRVLPNVSTPPSRFTKVINPFESNLIDRLHLSTFSPGVFQPKSTSKSEEKFKWTIDDISNLKPADIDESFSSHQRCGRGQEDATHEMAVQEKISRFFSEKLIVPSPMTEIVQAAPLLEPCEERDEQTPKFCDAYAQTVLTLPPCLPISLEEALKPYFTYTKEQQAGNEEDDPDSSLCRKLFGFEAHSEYEASEPTSSVQSSPAISTGLSPIQFSPIISESGAQKRFFNSPVVMTETQLKDCNLSPISKSMELRSSLRLNFSGHMSIDASLVVPDVNNEMSQETISMDQSMTAPPPPQTMTNISMANWELEYKEFPLSPPCLLATHELLNSDTPHSKYPSLRKRLSDSFKNEQDLRDVIMDDLPKRSKTRLATEVIDSGYHTTNGTHSIVTGGSYDESTHMFASTPTKMKLN